MTEPREALVYSKRPGFFAVLAARHSRVSKKGKEESLDRGVRGFQEAFLKALRVYFDLAIHSFPLGTKLEIDLNTESQQIPLNFFALSNNKVVATFKFITKPNATHRTSPV